MKVLEIRSGHPTRITHIPEESVGKSKLKFQMTLNPPNQVMDHPEEVLGKERYQRGWDYK